MKVISQIVFTDKYCNTISAQEQADREISMNSSRQ